MLMHCHENSFEKQVRGLRFTTDINLDFLSSLQKSAFNGHISNKAV